MATKTKHFLHGIFRLEMSFTKIEMERWSSNQIKINKTESNPEHEQQNPKITSNASTSTDSSRRSATTIRLRKHIKMISVLFV